MCRRTLSTNLKFIIFDENTHLALILKKRIKIYHFWYGGIWLRPRFRSRIKLNYSNWLITIKYKGYAGLEIDNYIDILFGLK